MIWFFFQVPDPADPGNRIHWLNPAYQGHGRRPLVPLESPHTDRATTPFTHVLGVTSIHLQYRGEQKEVFNIFCWYSVGISFFGLFTKNIFSIWNKYFEEKCFIAYKVYRIVICKIVFYTEIIRPLPARRYQHFLGGTSQKILSSFLIRLLLVPSGWYP